MIGRCTHVVDCREASGMGKGGSLAQRGTFAECGADVCAVAMSPGRRHITKPVCEITFGLREANVLTSTMVLNAGAGVPHDAPASGGTLFGLTDKEVEQMRNFKLLVIHLGGVANHIIYKARLILRNVNKHCIIICESPVDCEDFAKIGVKTSKVMPTEENVKTKGTIDDIVTGTVKELAERFELDIETMVGFLDGIDESLVKSNNLEEITEDSVVSLEYDKEKLYMNMVGCNAQWLYELPQWNDLLSEEKRSELYKTEKSSHTVVKPQKIGRNDPCPCGSGKKYKKCCGANL